MFNKINRIFTRFGFIRSDAEEEIGEVTDKEAIE